MKVIQKGNLIDPLTWNCQVKCPHCAALLEVEYRDLQTRSKTKISGPQWDTYHSTEKYSVIICPECSKEVEAERG